MPESYTLVELAKKSNQTTGVLRAYINAGKLEATKVKRGYRISAEEAERFLKEIEIEGMVEFENISIKKSIEYGEDKTAERIFGIPVGDIFAFLMKSLETIKEYNTGESGSGSTRPTPEDVKLLHHIIKDGKIDIIPREQRSIILDSDPSTSFLIRSMATGISCTFDELSKQQNFAVEADKIKAATKYIIDMLG